MNKHTMSDLYSMQAAPLSVKIKMTARRIRDWVDEYGQGRFELLKKTHPKFHNLLYVLKNNGVTYAEAIDWINEHGDMNIKY